MRKSAWLDGLRTHGRVGLNLMVGLALLGLAGCIPPNALEKDFGHSVANNVAQQVVNPRAGTDPTPAVGLAPKASVNEMEKYDKSFKPEEKSALSLKSISGY